MRFRLSVKPGILSCLNDGTEILGGQSRDRQPGFSKGKSCKGESVTDPITSQILVSFLSASP